MKTLKSMTDFVLWMGEMITVGDGSMRRFISIAIKKHGEDHIEQNNEVQFVTYWQIVNRYAEILQTKLELWMFVPCDKKGEPLEEPEEGQFKKHLGGKPFEELYNEYQDAKARCWFEGWGCHTSISDDYVKALIHGETTWDFNTLYNFMRRVSPARVDLKTVEEVITFGVSLTLSPALIERIGIGAPGKTSGS